MEQDILKEIRIIIQEELKGVNKRLDSMDQRFDGIDQRLDNMEEKIDSMDQRLDNMEEKVNHMEEKIGDMDEALTKLSATVDANTAAIIVMEDDLTRKVDILLEMYEENTKSHEKYDKKIKKLEAVTEMHNYQISALQKSKMRSS
jgi:chromosome segregation ATPase